LQGDGLLDVRAIAPPAMPKQNQANFRGAIQRREDLAQSLPRQGELRLGAARDLPPHRPGAVEDDLDAGRRLSRKRVRGRDCNRNPQNRQQNGLSQRAPDPIEASQ